MAVTEVLIDDAAHRLGLDPLDIRRRNYPADGAPFYASAGGVARRRPLAARLPRPARSPDGLSGPARGPGRRAFQEGRIEGIGVATLIELTAPGAAIYGAQEIDVTAEDTATVAMLPSGAVRVQVGCTDQGQGTLTGVGQLVAERLGLPPADVAVTAGDSAGPVGGGAWASRGLAIGGTAAWRAADAVAVRLLEIAATLLQEDAAKPLDWRAAMSSTGSGAERGLPVAEDREDRPLPPASAAAGTLDRPDRKPQLRAEDRALLCRQRHPSLPPGRSTRRPAPSTC